MLAKKKTPVDMRKRDVEACVLTPSIPAERCVGAVWVAYWACKRYHHLCVYRSKLATWDFYNMSDVPRSLLS